MRAHAKLQVGAKDMTNLIVHVQECEEGEGASEEYVNQFDYATTTCLGKRV